MEKRVEGGRGEGESVGQVGEDGAQEKDEGAVQEEEDAMQEEVAECWMQRR